MTLVEFDKVTDWLDKNLDRFMGNVWIIDDLLDELSEYMGQEKFSDKKEKEGEK